MDQEVIETAHGESISVHAGIAGTVNVVGPERDFELWPEQARELAAALISYARRSDARKPEHGL